MPFGITGRNGIIYLSNRLTSPATLGCLRQASSNEPTRDFFGKSSAWVSFPGPKITFRNSLCCTSFCCRISLMNQGQWLRRGILAPLGKVLKSSHVTLPTENATFSHLLSFFGIRYPLPPPSVDAWPSERQPRLHL